MIHCQEITLDEYKKYEKDHSIFYSIDECPFGYVFVAATEREICKLAFFDTKVEQKKILEELSSDWSKTHIVKDNTKIKPFINSIFGARNKSMTLLLRGTQFQRNVWKALLSVPEGKLVSYHEIAVLIKKPTAVRAVASAIAKNHIAFVIPCHRVIRKNGEYGGYRWNKNRKLALIEWEATRSNSCQGLI